MTIIVKIEPTVRAGDHTSHFVAVFHFDGKNFVDSGKRLHVGVNGIPNQVGEEPLYSEGRAVLLVEGWSDGSMESGERCPDIIPLIDRYKKPDSKTEYYSHRVSTGLIAPPPAAKLAEDSKPQDVKGLVEALELANEYFNGSAGFSCDKFLQDKKHLKEIMDKAEERGKRLSKLIPEALKTFKGEA